MAAIVRASRALEAILRRDLSSFIQKTFQTVAPGSQYSHNWHIDLIADYLEACTRGDITRLIINMPPRHLKSISCAIAWPAWLIGNDPTRQILAGSFAEKLAVTHSTACRNVIKSQWYRETFPEVRIASDQDEKQKFMTTRRGQRLATSVGTSPIGEGGDFIIVDDPINPKKADSEAARETANSWMQQLTTRLNDKEKGVIVLVMQRLHDNDPTGFLMREQKGLWEHLVIREEAVKKTVIFCGGREIVQNPGDILHPARMSAAAIAREKIALGSQGYAAQYQQSPVPLGGGMVQIGWFKRYRVIPAEFKRIVQSWDTAFKAKELNDPSVCLTFGETDQGYYLLDVFRKRMEYPDLKRAVLSMSMKYNPHAILIEDHASGQSLIQDYRADMQHRLPIIPIQIKAGDNKVVRMGAVSPKIEAGMMFIPHAAPWLIDFEQELAVFPEGHHDDQADALSQFLNWIARRPRVRIL